MDRKTCLKSLSLSAMTTLAASAAPHRPQSHFTPKAKQLIILNMWGGPSQMDTFDYKPQLQKDDGKDLPDSLLPELQRMQSKHRVLGKLMASPFEFKQHGQSGLWMSELFPELATVADDLCILKGMHHTSVDHGQAKIKWLTGDDVFERPSLGSWLQYGLESENGDLPGFMVLPGVFQRGYASSFLPARYQGTPLESSMKVQHLQGKLSSLKVQRQQLEVLKQLNQFSVAPQYQIQEMQGLEDALGLALKMQSNGKAVFDWQSEPESMQKAYGIGHKRANMNGRSCLMARRLIEAGVRVVQINYSGVSWDHHERLKEGLPKSCAAIDRPVATLIKDLKQRGLLDETLIVWAGEFGRTPNSQYRGTDAYTGRDHNPFGYSLFMAGGGVKGGFSYGVTDPYGYSAVREKVHIHDLHATILHLMGLDHERLTYNYQGRDFRLTDVHGNVVKSILA